MANTNNTSGGSTKFDSSSFQEFVRLCEAEGLLSRPIGLAPNDVCDGLNDQITLLRFFAARSGKPDAALAQFKEAVDIRNSIHHVATYDTMEVQDYEATRNLYPHWTGRRDKRGLPICMFEINHLDKATMSEYRKTRDMPVRQDGSAQPQNAGHNATQHAVAFHESLTRFILPLCSAMRDRPDPDTPISSAIYLVDISSFGVRQAYELRNYAQDISSLLATSFPEVVETVYVLNAPSYFSKIWSFLKKWIDPNTASKLVIVPAADVLPCLQSSIDIENIPHAYGGHFVFNHGMPPTLDASMCQQLEWVTSLQGTLPPGPIKWIVDDQGMRTAVAVGSVGNKARHEPIAILHPRRDSAQQISNERV